jgi:predicted alpha/beta-hydrolase family hydrolase
MTDGDHSLKPRKASGVGEADNLAAAVAAVVEFTDRL